MYWTRGTSYVDAYILPILGSFDKRLVYELDCVLSEVYKVKMSSSCAAFLLSKVCWEE